MHPFTPECISTQPAQGGKKRIWNEAGSAQGQEGAVPPQINVLPLQIFRSWENTFWI